MEKRKKSSATEVKEPAANYQLNAVDSKIPLLYRKMISDEYQLAQAASKGVDAKAIADFSLISGKPKEDIAAWIYITPKTIRNYESDNRKLPVLQSELLLKLYALYNKGLSVFGEAASFNSWLKLPAQGLYQKVPEDMLRTSTGIDLVCDELTRIEYGEFA